MTGITVSRRGDRLVAVKRADEELGRLRAEAERLRELDHPGVVRYVAFDEPGDGHAELLTEYVGTDTWARTPPSTAPQVLGRLTTLAETLADLHEQGIAHGALRAEHVVEGYDGRPVLCGFGDAVSLDDVAEADDMVGLAGLLRDLAPTVDGPARARLDQLARDAAAGAVDARGAAETLASLTTDPAASATPPGHLRTAAVVGGFVVVAAVFTLGLGRGPGARTELATAEPAVDAVTTTAVPDRVTTTSVPSSSTTTPPTTAAPTTTSTPATTTIRAESTPDPGVELVHEGRRYGLGAAGDMAVVGDWDCDGVVTPALLQFEHGVIAVFDDWPAPDEPLPAVAVDPAPQATAIEAVEQDGCHRLRILEPAGSRLFPFTPETS